MGSLRFDPSLLKIYRQSNFQVRDKNRRLIRFTVKTLKKHPEIAGKTFAVITAWNPMNKTMPRQVNQALNRKLAAALKARREVFYRSKGWLGRHCEEGFTVEGIRVPAILLLGRKFHQYAILYNDRRGPRFLRCSPGHLFLPKRPQLRRKGNKKG